MFAAAEFVRDRQARIIQLLFDASFQFALSGSNATFAWIASVDASAVRQYRNVELVIDRNDRAAVIDTLARLGLLADMRRDRILFWRPDIKHKRWADVALFAGEPVVDMNCLVPSLNDIEWVNGAPLISLEPLARFQMARWLLDDQVDLRDLIDVGIIGESWLSRLPADLATRLKELLDNPDG